MRTTEGNCEPCWVRGNQEQRKLVFVESASAMGGVEFSTLYLAQHLDRSRWIPCVVCPEEGDLPRECRRVGVPVHLFPSPRWRSSSLRWRGDHRIPNVCAWLWNASKLLRAARDLARFLISIQADVVVTKGFYSHLLGGLAARKLGTPCLWHVQDFISERWGGLNRRLFGWLACRLPTFIVADGGPITRQLPRRIQERVRVIHNGVDTTVFSPDVDGKPVRQELGIPNDAIVIGHVGRMTPWKGQHYLLEAFAPIAETCPQAKLLLVGSPVFDNDTYQRQLHSRTSELRLRDRVIFAGYRHDLPQVLAAMDIFAFTSVEKDTSPLALLSGMAAGLPIVAFDIAGVREIIVHGEDGLLVPVGKVEALSRVLVQVMADSGLRQRLAERARQRAEDSFSLKQHVAQMERVLHRVLASQSVVEKPSKQRL